MLLQAEVKLRRFSAHRGLDTIWFHGGMCEKFWTTPPILLLLVKHTPGLGPISPASHQRGSAKISGFSPAWFQLQPPTSVSVVTDRIVINRVIILVVLIIVIDRERRFSGGLSFPALGMGLHGFSEQFRRAEFVLQFIEILALLAADSVIILIDTFGG